MADRCTSHRRCDNFSIQNWGFSEDTDPERPRGYRMLDRHGESCAWGMRFCPWCGRKLPLRHRRGEDDA